jgi:UDP-glucuronate 4-epimerase
MQPGDVPQTCADAADLERAVGFRPDTPITEGVRRFVDWFLRFLQNGRHGTSPKPAQGM